MIKLNHEGGVIMLKLATVFSGIGAIEHALQRMDIDYEIVFACDNGDVNIFEKKIPLSLISVEREILILDQSINNLDLNSNIRKDLGHINDLEEHLNRIILEFENVRNKVYFDDINKHKSIDDLIYKYLEIARSINKDIKNMIDLYENSSIYNFDKLLILEALIKKGKIELNNMEFNYLISILNSKDFKGEKKNLKELIDNLSMLNEKIRTLEVHNTLCNMNSFEEKKKFVDSLYRKSSKTNFVKKSYFANYDIKEEDFHWNVSFIDGKQYENSVDLFVGGSPCQSFSMVGKQRGLQDTRGTLFYEYARLVKEIKPKVFIYENVRAVLSNDSGRTWEVMKAVFEEIGYDWRLMILNAKDFGIPQTRERIFVVGFRKDLVLNGEFLEPDKKELTKKMKDFLMENVSGKYYLNKKGVDFVTDKKNIQKKWTQINGDIQLCQKKNQQFNWHGDFVFEEENIDKEKTIKDLEKYFLSEKVRRYVLSSGTGNFYSRPEIDLDVARPLLTTMHKMHRAGIDNYVTTDGRIRKLTPRECLRLMGFCDSFKIVVSDTQIYQQAGNSIVVDVLIEIMKSIVKVLPQIINGENYKYKKIGKINNRDIKGKEVFN